MNKKLIAVALGLGTLAATLAGTAAQADPVGAPTYRVIAGGGSDTTEEVVQALSEVVTIGGTKVIANYNATGGAFNSKDPAVNPACTYAAYAGSNGASIRPNGSSAGRDRLVEATTPANSRFGCLDFARSSSGPGTSPLAQQMTYIPFGLDGVSYAVRSNSGILRTLSKAQLTSIYTCAAGTTANFTALIPQTGSGTRAFWLSYLGLTEGTLGSCVRSTWDDPNDGTTDLVPIQEHDGRVLLTTKEIVPFSAAQWSSQSAGVTLDKRGKAALANIGGIPAQGVNPAGLATRKVYNLIPTARVGDTATYPELNQVFVGPTSLVCQQTATIGKFGFGTLPDCGATTLTSVP